VADEVRAIVQSEQRRWCNKYFSISLMIVHDNRLYASHNRSNTSK